MSRIASSASVWIEPEWNWNRPVPSVFHRWRIRLNRTRVELKPRIQSWSVKLIRRLNRTRVELKLAQMLQPHRSRQRGLNRTRVELKRYSSLEKFRNSQVWIEPEWNWNRFTRSASTRLQSVWIEPEWNWNRRGRDRRYFRLAVWIEPEWNWNLKKDEQTLDIFTVWIEPEWNWNLKIRVFRVLSRKSLNRTRVELKPRSWRCRCCGGVVWIEPEWNWNSVYSTYRWTCCEFESNQSGIETDTLLFSKLSFISLNRTRVELKLWLLKAQSRQRVVWIEPEWNWNEMETRIYRKWELVWIEPEWNWNDSFWLDATDIQRVWIEPEWNWNFQCGWRTA